MSGVLLILADDMRADALRYMPFVSGVLRAEGTEFTNAFCNVPVCQASRVSLLTGQNAIHNGIYRNDMQTEWASGYTETIGTWLQAANVTTGMFGKLPNGYRAAVDRPGWDEWRIFISNEQRAYVYYLTMGTTGPDPGYIEQPGTHQLPTLAALVSSFMTGAGDRFAWWSPTNPHIDSAVVEGSLVGNNPISSTMRRYSWLRWPFDLLDDVTGKPTWIANGTVFLPSDLDWLRHQARQHVRECYDLDQAIAGIYADLDNAGRLADTTIIFTSDSGVFLGEQRSGGLFASGKNSPYACVAKAPLIIRGPDFPAGRRETTAVSLPDVTATIVGLNGAAPGITLDGTDLRQILAAPNPDRAVLYERLSKMPPDADDLPSGSGVFTSTHTMVRYTEGTGDPATDFTANPNDEYELYDRIADPGEKVNLANLGGDNLTLRNELEALLTPLLS